MTRAIAFALGTFGIATSAVAEGPVFGSFQQLTSPAQGQAQEPSLAASGEVLVMSWISETDTDTAVNFAMLDAGGWTQPAGVATGRDLFVNWADFPSVALFGDTGVALHWLRKSGRGGFDYNVELAISNDLGGTWADPIVPHSDPSSAQHGFVTMSGASDGALDLVWLDGRSYDKPGVRDTPDAMQLRTTQIAPDGRPGTDVAVDLQTCSCCQTSSARLGDGSLAVAYRDRTDDEIRDISVVRLAEGQWSAPVPVYAEGWEIDGCPVNGPAIAGQGADVAVAWFTGADDIAKVHVAFSKDMGQSFEPPFRIDRSEPLGRVDALMLEDGSALVTWLEWDGDDEVLRVCRVKRVAGCVAHQELARNGAAGSMNFPRMARLGADVVVAWTQPTSASQSTVVLARGQLAPLE